MLTLDQKQQSYDSDSPEQTFSFEDGEEYHSSSSHHISEDEEVQDPQKNDYLLMPNDPRKKLWDFVVGILLIVSCLTIPA